MSDRKRLGSLNKLVERSRKKTDEKRLAKREKKIKRVQEAADFRLEHPEKFEPKKVAKDKDKNEGCGQTDSKVLKSSHVMSWFRKGIEDAYDGNVVLPGKGQMWTHGQRGMAKKILELYEPEEVEQAVKYLCENWKEMVLASNGKLHGLPTINLLYAQHMRIFNDAKSGKPFVSPRRARKDRRDADEYRDGKHIGAGWG